MKDKWQTLEIIKELHSKLSIPFSIKSRTGLDEVDKSRHLDFLIEVSNYCDKISVHSRTLKELYHWEWDRDFIYNLKNKANTKCKIIWNWGISSFHDIENKICKNWTILNGIMIWQAAIWNPRIFTDHEPNKIEKINTAIEHLKLQAKYEIFFKYKAGLETKNISKFIWHWMNRVRKQFRKNTLHTPIFQKIFSSICKMNSLMKRSKTRM